MEIKDSDLEVPLCRDRDEAVLVRIEVSRGKTGSRQLDSASGPWLAENVKGTPLLGSRIIVALTTASSPSSSSPPPPSPPLPPPLLSLDIYDGLQSVVTTYYEPRVNRHLPAKCRASYRDLQGSLHHARNTTITQNICADREYETKDICTESCVLEAEETIWGESLERSSPRLPLSWGLCDLGLAVSPLGLCSSVDPHADMCSS